MRQIFLLGCLAALAACAPPMAEDPGDLPGRSANSFVVRTAATAPSGVDLDVRGVGCVAAAPGFELAFQSPARVTVPYAGPQAPAVTVRCQGGGRSGEGVALPRAGRGYGGWSVYPSIGVGLSTGGDVDLGIGTWLSPRPRRDYAVTYPDLRVLLR